MSSNRCPYCHQTIDPGEYLAHLDRHKNDWKPDGQLAVYPTLPPEERESGDLQGVPRVYRHTACGSETVMPVEIVRTYLRDPYLYMSNETHCVGCGWHVPFRECTWVKTGENLQDYLDELRTHVGIVVGLLDEWDNGPCSCCGKPVRSVSGSLKTPRFSGGYYVMWVVGEAARHSVAIDLLLSPWSEGPARGGNWDGVAVDYRPGTVRPFTLADAAGRPMAGSKNMTRQSLTAAEVVAAGLADMVFAVAAAVLQEDHRLADVAAGA